MFPVLVAVIFCTFLVWHHDRTDTKQFLGEVTNFGAFLACVAAMAGLLYLMFGDR